MAGRLTTRLTSLFSRNRLERDLDRELRFHIDMLTDQHVKGGMTPAEARRAARHYFCGVEQIKEDVRETWL